MDSKRERIGPFVVTTRANIDPGGAIVCESCGKVLARLKPDGSHEPTPEELLAAGRIPVPNFGWFCDQKCGAAFERKTGIAFQRDIHGDISYYPKSPPAEAHGQAPPKRSATAEIKWLTPEEGGRSAPPGPGRYATVARFERQDDWPKQAWTLVVQLGAPDGRNPVTATVHFLVDEAPHHLLEPGARFELLEARPVARGRIVALADDER